MKRTVSKVIAALLVIAAILTLAACANLPPEGLWESATYRNDMTFGNGAKTIEVTVEAGEYSVVFTVKTDKTTLADALLEHGLISGEETTYGFTVYYVNGIRADFNTDGAYWSVYEGESYATSGVSFIELEDGDSFKLAYTTL